MTPEQRFDRLERIVRLMIRSGLRSRRISREQDEKINIIIGMQMDNARGFAELREAQARLTESQAHSDRRLDVLIDIVRGKQNRNGSAGTT